MSIRRPGLTTLGICFVAGIAVGGYAVHRWWPEQPPVVCPKPVDAEDSHSHAQLASDRPNTVVLPDEVIQSLGIRSVRIVANTEARPLRMPGSLMLDSNRLARIHSRFEGHVMSLGTIGKGKEARPLQFGDSVYKDQVLAVVWSKEIGQKKSELLDAYSQFSLNKATLERLKTLKPGEVSEHVLRDAQRNYESALIAVQNGERTLRSWQLSETDILDIRHEADRLHREGSEQPAMAALREGWAELAIRAPFEGVILEKNVTIGELVDPSLDLFKIADVRRLMVAANVYEEDLSEIESLAPAERKWKLSLMSEPDAPPISGEFDVVGRIIDPVQHTAQLVGWIDNPNNRYMAGQFISALVTLPPRQHEVVVPTSSVIETGDDGIIYTVDPHNPNEFVRHRVVVSHRGRTLAFLRTELTDDERTRGVTAVGPDLRVVASGVVLLENTWKELSLTATATNEPRLARQTVTEQ